MMDEVWSLCSSFLLELASGALVLVYSLMNFHICFAAATCSFLCLFLDRKGLIRDQSDDIPDQTTRPVCLCNNGINVMC